MAQTYSSTARGIVKDLRRHPRRPVAWPVRVWLSEHFFLDGRAVDASAHGIAATLLNWVAADILKVGDAYRLDVQPQTGDGFACLAEIRHLSPHAVGWKIVIALPRILVVDDDPVVCELLTAYFGSKGYRVAHAGNAAEALTAVRRGGPDLVLLDIGLPGMNGLVALRHLRREYPGVAVIMITGTQDPTLARASARIGAVEYVCKPFDLKHLDHLVTSTLTIVKPFELGAWLD